MIMMIVRPIIIAAFQQARKRCIAIRCPITSFE